MADKPPSLQDIFLNGSRRGKIPVTLFLMKGVKLQGTITWSAREGGGTQVELDVDLRIPRPS